MFLNSSTAVFRNAFIMSEQIDRMLRYIMKNRQEVVLFPGWHGGTVGNIVPHSFTLPEIKDTFQFVPLKLYVYFKH